MALFGGRRNIVQRIQQARFRNDQERDQLLTELKESDTKAVDLLPLLFHDNVGVRQVVGQVFAQRADVSAVNAAAREVVGKSSNQRTSLMQILTRISPDILSQVVEAMFTDKNEKVQRAGWEVVLAIGGPVGVQYLRRAVIEAPFSLRGPALRRLLQIAKPREIVDELIEATKSSDTRLASTALEAVSDLDDPRLLTLMIDRLGKGDAAVRDQATKWLLKAAKRDSKHVRKEMMGLLAEGEDSIRRMCLEVLFETGDMTEIMVEVFEFVHSLMGWLRTQIVNTLKSFGDRLLSVSVKLLNHESEDVRSAALLVAESFNDPRLVGPFCRMLQDEDWWLKVSACDSLAQLKDKRAVPFLVAALDDEDCCWAAVDALAQIGDPSSLTALAHLVTSDRPELRLEAIKSFLGFRDKRLIQLLQVVKENDPSTEVRTRAAEVIRDIGAKMNVSVDNTEVTAAVSSKSFDKPADQILTKMREMGGSDLHISIGEPPIVRMKGTLERMEGAEPLTAEESRAFILSVLSEKQQKLFLDTGEIDFCYSVPGVGRYRANAYVQRLGIGGTFRAIPNTPPTFADIRMPGHLTELLEYHQGIIVVSGPAGSGKSTTLAAIVNLINETKPTHILTLEEPIEFVHPVKTALVNQREIGKHSESFHSALRGALREDPDVIVVGEMRDPEVIRMAMEAAETGHLVITTLHTTSAIQTVERLISSFPPEEQQQIRMGLSESLKFVICQQLLPRKDGTGRVAVFEILKRTFNVGNLIRDDKTYQLPSAMQIGRNQGMQTVDMALMELVESDLITAESAYLRAQQPDNFVPLCSAEFVNSQRNVSEAVVE